VVVTPQRGPGVVRILSGASLAELDGFFAFDPRLEGGAAVG
jgi:hypothetical protein